MRTFMSVYSREAESEELRVEKGGVRDVYPISSALDPS
jgi:hypothetical protein